jgi:predicted acyl esterase
VLFCPTASLADRVPTWDGVPIDVDVTLPPDGDGPFPAIVMVHGLGGSKTDFEKHDAGDAYNNVFYAQRGYAVMNLSLRGYGDSCGKAASRAVGNCDRGWQHLADQAFEVRDVQTLVGMLVDQGVVRADAIGATGISYGGGTTNQLAYLRDRVRLPEGTLIPWTSPNGTPLQISAAWSRWGWSDLAASLAPNGRFLETAPWRSGQSIEPPGIEKASFISGLYFLANTAGFIPPPGGDANADLATAREQSRRGEPFAAGLKAFLTLMSERKSAAGLFGSVPAPLLVQDGWTDDLFTPQEALRIYNDTNGGTEGPVALQLGDLGHGRGANKPAMDAFFNAQGAAFFDAYLKRTGTAPAAGSVTAFTQTCPTTRAPEGPFAAATWSAMHPGSFRLAGAKPQTVSSAGGDPEASRTFDKVLGGNPCGTAPAGKAKASAVYRTKVRTGFTMIGLPLINAKVAAKGRFGQLDAHLYDVFRGRKTLVTRGQYRLTPNQKGAIRFQLNGGGWRFAKGHSVELALLGTDSGYMRPSNGKFSVTVRSLSASLPSRELHPR